MRATIRLLLLACALILPILTAWGQEIYWERPQVIEDQRVRFSNSAAGGGRMVVAWEQIVPGQAAGSGTIYLSLGASTDGATWTWHRRFFGPIQYSGLEPGSEPLVYSMVVDKDGRIVVAVTSAEREITILASTNAGLTFTPIAHLQSQLSLVAPSLFLTDAGTLLLFATEEASRRSGLSLAWSSSPDGRAWAPFAPFIAPGEPGEGIQLQPDHAVIHGREVIVFQAQKAGADDYQLYFKESMDGGNTWLRAREITGLPAFRESVDGTQYDARSFTNQRPSIASIGSSLGLAWERTLLGGATASIYYCELDDDGTVTRPMEPVDPAASLFAQLIQFGSRELLLYQQNTAGEYRVVLSEKGKEWSPQVVGRGFVGSSQWPHGVAFKGSLYLFWEVRNGDSSQLVAVRPKTSVASPSLVAVGFQPGVPVRSDLATVRWRQPDDSVGIESYDVTVSYAGAVVERKRLIADSPDMTFSRPVSKDGTWRIEVVAQDLAHNLSKPVFLDLVRKTTPPHPVKIAAVPTDASGYLLSNSFTINWSPSTDKDVVGYTWEEQRVAASPEEYQASKVKLLAPPDRPLTTGTSITFDNLENGIHTVTVQAIDRAGNVSEPSTVLLRLNKFKPFTAIYAVLHTVDDMGAVHLTIRGRGFIANGAVQAVYLTRSEAPPYDRVLKAGTDAFSVTGDTQITGPVLDNSFPSGSYTVGLLQTSGKPYFWSGERIQFEVPGTIKVGSFSVLLPRWIAGGAPRYGTPFDRLIVVVIVALLVVVGLVSLRSMVSVAQEGILIRNEVLALLEGRPSAAWEERKTRMKELHRRGVGLRLKFTLLMVVLVTIIVLIVSVPLGVQMIGQQSHSLADGLDKRTRLLIGTIAASAEAEIRKGTANGGDVGISSVPDIIKPMEEAVFTTITGPADATRFPNTSARDFVWASNSDAWKKRKAAGTFEVAIEQEKDELSASIVPDLQKRVNDAAPRTLAAELEDWQKARDRVQELSGLPNRTAKQQAELKTILTDLPKKVTAIDNGLKTLPENGVYSSPPFDPHKPLAPRYLFYKPIVYFHPEDKSFYQGLVRIEVNTTTITRQIADSRNGLIRSTALIALAAIALGILGAVIMASITVTPIRKLARGVEVIRDTQDKEELKDHKITVRTRDEIGLLAATVNDMTHGLVEAAKANKQLMIGKDVQKRFLPLVKSADKKSSNTAEEENDKVVMYGYYEGAKGVSGDYFDLKKLDEIHYALIKCDVAGKGVPAALIMVEVATLFINYFRDWLKRKDQVTKISDPKERQRALKALERIDSLVYTINDMVEERGFDGRFAALTIAIYNAATGEVSICHAGDNIVNIYRAAEKSMVPITLAEAPAAGSIPSFMVEMKSPYTQVVQKLSPGDVLFLYTDGLEEAQRNLRNARFEISPCDAAGLKDGDEHLGTHKKGETKEEFGRERIKGVVNAVFNKGRFRLVRSHNPVPEEDLDFDFSSSAATVKEAVLALVAVEKVYRMIPDPSAGAESRVIVDEKVDEFLRQHFLQYKRYFSHPVEGQQLPGYLTFTHTREDEQYDDLTLLVIRRK
jgi:Stage II sporulation protein E (SpoIIE)/HAMP domain